MIRHLSYIIFIVPVITVAVSYIISFNYNYVETCIPLIDGCTSISKVGRYGVSFYLYKFFIIPNAVLIILFWREIYNKIFKNKMMFVMSIMACVFLIVYLCALGFEGSIYRFMREIGIFVSFVLMPICQIWIIFSTTQKKLIAQYVLYLIVFLYIILACAYFYILPFDNANYENVIEWNFALLIFLFFPIFSYSITT